MDLHTIVASSGEDLAERVRTAMKAEGVDIDAQDEKGRTPLYIAARDGKSDILKIERNRSAVLKLNGDL